jgi:hypothetical protein
MGAAEHRESNMRQHHSDRLLRIITLRRQFQSVELYDFIVSYLCFILRYYSCHSCPVKYLELVKVETYFP